MICYIGIALSALKGVAYDGAIISDIPILQEQVCEICAPFLIRLACMKVLVQFVPEYFMRLPWLCPWFFRAGDGMQPRLCVHIFMDGSGAVAVSFTLQIGCHGTVAVNTVIPVVDFIYLPQDFCFLGIIIRLPVFPVVIVGIRADPQPLVQPAGAEFFMVLVNKPVSL